MASLINKNLDYDRPIKIADDIYWVGFIDKTAGLHCNPYLIVDENEAVLIDGGSRPDFSTVMMKIMETGAEPKIISHLIYQHYDPDLCGSIPNLEDIIARKDLRIVSHRENNIFIRYYGVKSKLSCIDVMELKLVLKSGRTLKFFKTPYAHSAGSFMTFDEKRNILFTSDIFGSYGTGEKWDLFLEFDHECSTCTTKPSEMNIHFDCKKINNKCPFIGILNFHRRIMTSCKALKYALKIVRSINPSIVAPQHGSILFQKRDIEVVLSKLLESDDIGIEGVLKG